MTVRLSRFFFRRGTSRGTWRQKDKQSAALLPSKKIEKTYEQTYPIGSMYAIYANIWGILMVNVTIYSIHGSYGNEQKHSFTKFCWGLTICGFQTRQNGSTGAGHASRRTCRDPACGHWFTGFVWTPFFQIGSPTNLPENIKKQLLGLALLKKLWDNGRIILNSHRNQNYGDRIK